MLYQPTLQDILTTLPPADQAELVILIGTAAVAEHDDAPDTEDG